METLVRDLRQIHLTQMLAGIFQRQIAFGGVGGVCGGTCSRSLQKQTCRDHIFDRQVAGCDVHAQCPAEGVGGLRDDDSARFRPRSATGANQPQRVENTQGLAHRGPRNSVFFGQRTFRRQLITDTQLAQAQPPLEGFKNDAVAAFLYAGCRVCQVSHEVFPS